MAPKKNVRKSAPKKADPLFKSTPYASGIGGNIRPTKDISRFVRWPKYVRIQRQRAVLYQRLKVPPSINQFTTTLNKNEAMTVFSLLNKYRPETPAVKKQRIKDAAAAAASGDDSSAPERQVNQVK